MTPDGRFVGVLARVTERPSSGGFDRQPGRTHCTLTIHETAAGTTRGRLGFSWWPEIFLMSGDARTLVLGDIAQERRKVLNLVRWRTDGWFQDRVEQRPRVCFVDRVE